MEQRLARINGLEPRWPLLAAGLLGLVACSTPGGPGGDRPSSTRAHEVAAGPSAVVAIRLPAGTRLRLRPVTVSSGLPEEFTESATLDALLREAFLQSPRFDIDGAEVDLVAKPPIVGKRDTHRAVEASATAAQPTHEIDVHYDHAASAWSTALVRPGSAPLPLASDRGDLFDALDRLAVHTRQALGETEIHSRPIGQVYSKSARCIQLTEAANELGRAGLVMPAIGNLRRARREDPGSTPTLATLAANLLVSGQAKEATTVARAALALEDRLAPTTQHRLARTMLLARATVRTTDAGTPADRNLLQLADVTMAERPFDPEPVFSKALALNLQGRYGESTPLLEALAKRWPKHPGVAYHRTFAALATGRHETAIQSIEGAFDRLPAHSRVLPRALALFHAERHDELRGFLAELSASNPVRNSAQLHEVRRMQVAHAILTGDSEAATRAALTDLEWIRRRPSRLNRFAADVAELGEVLVRLDRAADLRVPLRAFEELGNPPELFSQVLVYLGGLVDVAATRKRATAAEAHLRKADQQVWSSALKAAAHRRRGELMEELQERVFEFSSTDDPLLRASLAHALRSAGEEEDAGRVVEQLRQRLLGFRLHRLREHPLLSPGAALAFLITPAH